MALRFPQGSVSSLISLAAGAITASAVALAWLPLLTESAQRELTNEAHHLHALVRLAQVEEARHPAGSSEELQALTAFQTNAGVDALWLTDTEGAILYSVPSSATPSANVAERIRDLCARPSTADSAGLGETIAFITDAAALRAACVPSLDQNAPRFVVVLAQNDTWAPLARSRSHATYKLIFLGAIVALIVILGIRWLLSPIQKISTAAGQIARGERQVRVAVRGPEEIAELARAVNALASSVETREDEIRGRMEVVNEISSMVAHEIRNPLQSLELLTTLARTEPDQATRDNLLTTMEQEIRTLEGVVQRVLRSSGPLRIAPASSDLVEIVHRAANMAEPEARRRNVALLVQAPGALEARVDGSLIRRAFENLLHNAIEFAGQNPPGQVTASLSRHGNLVRMLVDDDGPGVSEPEIGRIFQPYYSSKSGGIGLGLALCKQVFDAHGGRIRYETSPLGGARFVAELPLEATDTQDHTARAPRA